MKRKTIKARRPSTARVQARRPAPPRQVAAHRAPADEHAARELVMYIENESDLSPDGPRGQGRDVLLNALRRWRKGTYDPKLAVRLFEYLAESAGLPGPIRDVVKQTVRRTRLLRIEKSDVARELISHFRDGLDAGADASALASSFGDTRVAARLIRRAKKRESAR